MLAISFFFSSTSSISRAISPSDMDSSSSSEPELESEELEEKKANGDGEGRERFCQSKHGFKSENQVKIQINDGLLLIYFTLQHNASLIKSIHQMLDIYCNRQIAIRIFTNKAVVPYLVLDPDKGS